MTAVDWLQIELDSILDLNPSEFGKVQQAFDHAKKMEEEQLQKSWEIGFDDATSQAIKETHKYQ